MYTDIEGLMTRYGTLDIGSIDIAALLTELIEIMSANELAMPAQLTLLARGMTTIEGDNCRFKSSSQYRGGSVGTYFGIILGKC